ncbi:MAG: ribose-5-phosphate isomerase RpiA [Leptonema sp. (in: Bacteria)]|nr:ribose-5-phosphate isomerase RpiA [Leptonema sp. (in: bacteria)]
MKDVNSNSTNKQKVGIAAANRVEPNMIVGIGTGSTTAFAIIELGRRIKEEKLQFNCCVTSYSSLMLCLENEIRPMPIENFEWIDLSIDGADEADLNLNLIKGGGAAHAREKIVHALSNEFICIIDESKLVERLGKFKVPIEVLPVALTLVKREIQKLGAFDIELRMSVRKDGPVISDNGNLVIDAHFEINDALKLEKEINSIPGVVENGIFATVLPAELLIGGNTIRSIRR